MTLSVQRDPVRRRPRPARLLAAAGALAGLVVIFGGSHPARAQPAPPYGADGQPDNSPQGQVTDLNAPYEGGQVTPEGVYDQSAGAPVEAAALVPPNAEGDPYAAQTGTYCYDGAHPVDTRVIPGASWDPTEGRHLRPYPPIDLRLFAFANGCYSFVGDPVDFGYAGQTYSYYGAHPLLAAYGGGWCFMMGGHNHLWRPWSPYFTVVGSWNYWRGPYDPFFWTYWPYYSVYYRSYYPHYYGGGRFYRGGGYHVAPPLRDIRASTWRGAPYGRVAPAYRGAAPAQMYNGGTAPATRGGQWSAPGSQQSYVPRGTPGSRVGGAPSFSPGPGRSFSPGPRSYGSPAAHGGGFGSPGHGSFHGGGRR